MIIKPRVKDYLCLTAHPEGCKKNVEDQIAYVKAQGDSWRCEESVSDRMFYRIWTGIKNRGSFWMSCRYPWNHA